jgi:hypothetical protein
LASYEDPAFSNCNQAGSVGTQGGDIAFNCVFHDSAGAGVAGVNVTFSQKSGPRNSRAIFNPVTAVTDPSGRVNTAVTLPANSPGSYVLAATTARITVTATVREERGFPLTSADPAIVPAVNQLAETALLAGILIIALGLMALLPRRA